MAKKPDKPEDSNRVLRWVVISMGFVLLGGTVLLFVLAFQKIRDKAAQAEHKTIPKDYRECGHHRLTLQKGETVQDILWEGPIARVTTRQKGGATVLRMVQSCTGQELGSLTIDAAP